MTDAESRPSTMSTQFKGSYSSGVGSFAPVAVRVLELVSIASVLNLKQNILLIVL